jgi:UDP-N-acetylmuramoyl-tripeptide--D-alanyl-D-alanine ligase
MSEISDADASHQLVADIASELGVVVLACETDLYGVPSMSVDQIVELVKLQQPSAVLVKGSRVAATERVVDALLTA